MADGWAALRSGDWQAAQVAFEAEAAAHEQPPPVALAGLARAQWWLGDIEAAVSLWERAHRRFREVGDVQAAIRCALWVEREYRVIWANHAAANGWFAKAERLSRDLGPSPEQGWVDWARAERATDFETKAAYAQKALDQAHSGGDAELEAYALAGIGLARVGIGQIDDGVSHLDEAMATATTLDDPAVVGDIACTLMEASDMLGDVSRFSQWTGAIMQSMTEHHHLPLLSFCGTCCGEAFAAAGRWQQAEEELLGAVKALERTAQRSRCSHPAARLAQLRIRQGRLEEAAAVVEPFADLPEMIAPRAALHLARGQPAAAAMLLERRLVQTGERNLPAVPLAALLADAHIAQGNPTAAAALAGRLGEFAARVGTDRVVAIAALVRGRVAEASDDIEAALASFQQALDCFQRAAMPLEVAVVHKELAMLLARTDHERAKAEADAALAGFEELGASRYVDEVRALLRGLGVRGTSGPRNLGLLTRREREVLDLLALGLSNAEVAKRLFISTKTAGNHVSNILTKLGMRSRTEAAAFAVRAAQETGTTK